jgi:hypothetical protein
MLTELAECTVLMLKVIHEMYSKQRITYEDFLDFTEVKIQFLLENMKSISSEVDRRNASDIINKCISLMSQSNSQHMMNNIFCFNTDIIQ